MRLLHRETEVEPEAPAAPVEAPAGAPDAVAAPEGVRACPTCHAALADDQDWCLQCGAAQSRLAVRMPGMRTAGTIAALTAVLVGGAVAASYAALQQGPAPTPPTPTQVAQAPAAVAPAPSTATPPATDPVPAAPATSAVPPAPVVPPSPPKVSSPPPTPTPSSSSSHTSKSGGNSSGSKTTSTSSGSGTSTTTTTDTTAPAPTPIKLDPSAASLYDPYTRDTAAGDPTKALDHNPSTSFPIAVADGSATIGAGLALDLGKKRGIREIDLTLKTPGVGLEVYATDAADLPPDVLDSRWAHLRSLASAGSATDGHQTISLGSGTSKYRHLLLWFTTPPESGTTVRVTEAKLLG